MGLKTLSGGGGGLPGPQGPPETVPATQVFIDGMYESAPQPDTKQMCEFVSTDTNYYVSLPPAKRSLGQRNSFTSVCHSVHV